MTPHAIPRPLFLALAAALLLAAPALGAQATAETVASAPPVAAASAEPGRTVVTFTLRGRVQNTGDAASQLPTALVRRLGAEPSLAELTVGGAGTQAFPPFQAIFVFSSQEEFDRWYASPAAREVLRAVDEAASQQVSMELSVRRFPLVNFLPQPRQ